MYQGSVLNEPWKVRLTLDGDPRIKGFSHREYEDFVACGDYIGKVAIYHFYLGVSTYRTFYVGLIGTYACLAIAETSTSFKFSLLVSEVNTG